MSKKKQLTLATRLPGGCEVNIDFNDQGKVATVTITSTVFEFRRHIRVVDELLLTVPGVVAKRTGFFLMKTVISGPVARALRVYRLAQMESLR